MNPINLSIVGTSQIAKKFVIACRDVPEIIPYGVYSRTFESGSAFAEEMTIPYVFIEYEEMLKNTSIDAVYIASPNAYHFKQAQLALQYGKHVICEKAITSNLKELELLIEQAKEKNLLIVEAMKSLGMPTYKQVKINLEKIGKVRKAVFNYCQYSSKYPAYLAGENPNIFNPKFSAGALMDIGIYCIYPCIDLFGMPKAIKSQATLLDNGIDGGGSILLEYGDKEVSILYSKINDSSLGSEIMGEEGTLFIDAISSPVSVELRKKGQLPLTLSSPLEHDSMYYEIREFADTLIKGKTESAIYSYQLTKNIMSILDQIRRDIGLIFPADL